MEWGNLPHRARGDFIDDANSILRSFINSIHDIPTLSRGLLSKYPYRDLHINLIHDIPALSRDLLSNIPAGIFT